MAISARLAGKMIAGDQSVYYFNLWFKTVDFIRYIFTGRSLQEDDEILFNLLNINRLRILDRIPVTYIKALRHVLGFIRMIDSSPPELRTQYGLQRRFRDGRIAVRLSYDHMMIREVLLTEEAFGLLNNVFTVNKRGAMNCVEYARTMVAGAEGWRRGLLPPANNGIRLTLAKMRRQEAVPRGDNPFIAMARQRGRC